jgi:hypothetical protein
MEVFIMTQKQIIKNALSDIELASLISESDYVSTLYDVNEKCETIKEQFIDNQHDLLQYDIFYEAAKINFKYNPRNKQEKEIVDLYKFDHTHIRNAQRHFQNAYDYFFREHLGDNFKSLKMHEIVSKSEEFKRGIKELELQFDCKINYKLANMLTGTATIKNLNKRLTLSLSKNKGFQLNGAELDIMFAPAQDNDINKPEDFKFAGQVTASSFLHEIFHNIAFAINFDGHKLCNTIGDEYDGFVKITSIDQLETKCDECVEKICKKLKINMHQEEMNKASKLLYKSMKIIALGNEEKVKTYIRKLDYSLMNEKELEEDVEDTLAQIEKDKKVVNAYDTAMDYGKAFAINFKTFGGKVTFTMIVLTSLLKSLKITRRSKSLSQLIGIMGAISGISAFISIILSVIFLKSTKRVIENMKKEIGSQPMEEHFCDLFAAMYNLPLIFDVDMVKLNAYRKKLGSKTAEKVANEMKDSNGNDVHPSNFERTRSSYLIAGDLLKHHKKDLSKEEIAYLKYIRKNFKGIDKIKIKRNKNDRSRMDYEKDMNKHLNRIVKHLEDAGVTITESFNIDDYMDLLYMEYAIPNNTFYEDD